MDESLDKKIVKPPKHLWGLQEKVFCVENYFRHGRYKIVFEKFREHFKTDICPHKTCVQKWVIKFRKYGHLGNLPSAIELAQAARRNREYQSDSAEMSSQKGNVKRSRGQKHQNSSAFKNSLHDKSAKTKFLNSLQIDDVCPRCKAILEWKIKYKKYKILKHPGTCLKCRGRHVTLSYRILCELCATSTKSCPKCGKSETEWTMESLNPSEDDLVSSSDDEDLDEGEDNKESLKEWKGWLF